MGANYFLQAYLSCHHFRYLQALCLKAFPDQGSLMTPLIGTRPSKILSLA